MRSANDTQPQKPAALHRSKEPREPARVVRQHLLRHARPVLDACLHLDLHGAVEAERLLAKSVPAVAAFCEGCAGARSGNAKQRARQAGVHRAPRWWDLDGPGS